MKPWVALIILIGLTTAACSATPTPIPRPSPAAGSPSPSPVTSLGPCQDGQLVLTAGQSGGAGGTNYLTVFVELAQGPACALPLSPMVTIEAPDATTIAAANETDPQPVALTYVLRYHIAWSADCRSLPSGDLAAHVAFSASLVIDVPIGGFRPSHCMNASGQTLSMYAEEPG